MPKVTEIKSGQRYRIRQWEDLAAEYGGEERWGSSDDTVIHTGTQAAFLGSMRYLCGVPVVFVGTLGYYERGEDEDEDVVHHDLVDGALECILRDDGTLEAHRWSIVADMLEPASLYDNDG